MRSEDEQALYEATLSAARAWSLSVAFLFFLVGFILDDVRWARVPGFALGTAGALLSLGLGSALVAQALAGHLAQMRPPAAQRAVRRHTLVARLSAVAVVVCFSLWLLVTSGGVPPWLA